MRCPSCVVTEEFCVAVSLRSVEGFCVSTEGWAPECFLEDLIAGLGFVFLLQMQPPQF